MAQTVTEEQIVVALDALHGKNLWRVPYRTKHGEGMLRNDMRLLLEAAVAARLRCRDPDQAKAN